MNKILYLISIIFIITACSSDPVPIKYGYDSCEHCRMTITDKNFGAELITNKGKIYKYDSIECLATNQKKYDLKDIHSMWVVNFYPTNELININNAYFLLSENLKSPMGLYLSAYKDDVSLKKVAMKYGGKKINWKELINYVEKEWN